MCDVAISRSVGDAFVVDRHGIGPPTLGGRGGRRQRHEKERDAEEEIEPKSMAVAGSPSSLVYTVTPMTMRIPVAFDGSHLSLLSPSQAHF